MLKIIYEDDYLIVVNKPPHLLTIPAPGKSDKTLTDRVNEYISQSAVRTPHSAIPKAHPCHRLDYETSGIIIYAKGKKMQQAIIKQFHTQSIKKKYIAFVHGHPARPNGALKGLVDGKPALTRYRVIEKREGFSVVEVEPITGRTNQIRIQFRQLGHPVVGERRFAFARDYKLKFRRTALHASEISFTHPVTNKPLSFSAPLPDDMQKFYINHREHGDIKKE